MRPQRSLRRFRPRRLRTPNPLATHRHSCHQSWTRTTVDNRELTVLVAQWICSCQEG
ncbi:MAG: hypothetical protein DVB33_07460 [Verrucomicrobia bacterium]|nr:MAG: hypothetical protein DVB33_07460 [Verrucomicrobiota bacterium]